MPGPVLILDVIPGEARGVLLGEGRAARLAVERAAGAPVPGDIFLGRVARVAERGPAFVALGVGAEGALFRRHDAPLSEGDAVVVQVRQGAAPGKLPELSTALALAGRFLLWLPEGEAPALSRRIGDLAERQRLREIAADLAPEAGAFLVRHNAEGADERLLYAEADWLCDAARALEEAERRADVPALLMAAPPPALRILRDDVPAGGAEIRVHAAAAASLRAHALTKLWALDGAIMPAHADDIALLDDAEAEALAAEIGLPSGARLVIEETEAATLIDVDRARATGDNLRVNLDAMDEAARQIRLRNLSGLIVVDGLRLRREDDREAFVEAAREALADDDVDVRVLGLSRAGLLEITRERRRPSLLETLAERAAGPMGSFWPPRLETRAFDLLRRLRAEGTGAWVARVAPALGALLEGALGSSWAEIAQETGARLEMDANLAPDGFDLVPAKDRSNR